PPPETKLKILKQVFIFLLLLATFSVLVSFLVLALKERVFTVRATSAYISADLRALRAPITGFFNPEFPLKPGVEIKKGTVVGYMRSPVFGSIVITSPIEGKLIRLNPSLPVVKEGEPILFVLPPGGRVFVKAFVPHNEGKGITVGKKVLIYDAHGGVFSGTIQRILIGIGKDLPETKGFEAFQARSPDYDTLIIIPEHRLDVSRIGEAVHVEITVYPRILKRLFGEDEG
ncbi:MAG: HlyD family secretion protein, partial [Deferribacteres bacterium]|nr:HlyD family secretion protein [Deferribacteres bacterium]